MLYEVRRLSKDYKYSGEVEKDLLHLLYNQGYLPKPVVFSTGNEPLYDAIHEDGSKTEVKIQTMPKLWIEIQQVDSRRDKGIRITEVDWYVMINQSPDGSKGVVRIHRTIDIRNYIVSITEPSGRIKDVKARYGMNCVVIDPINIPHIVAGTMMYNPLHETYDSDTFTP